MAESRYLGGTAALMLDLPQEGHASGELSLSKPKQTAIGMTGQLTDA
jgi:hypothetical protein